MENQKPKSAPTVETVQNYINDLAEQRFYSDLKAAVEFVENSPILRDLKIDTSGTPVFLTNLGRSTLSNKSVLLYGFNLPRVVVHMSEFTNITELKESLIEEYIKQETAAFLDKVVGTSEDYPF